METNIGDRDGKEKNLSHDHRHYRKKVVTDTNIYNIISNNIIIYILLPVVFPPSTHTHLFQIHVTEMPRHVTGNDVFVTQIACFLTGIGVLCDRVKMTPLMFMSLNITAALRLVLFLLIALQLRQLRRRHSTNLLTRHQTLIFGSSCVLKWVRANLLFCISNLIFRRSEAVRTCSWERETSGEPFE